MKDYELYELAEMIQQISESPHQPEIEMIIEENTHLIEKFKQHVGYEED